MNEFELKERRTMGSDDGRKERKGNERNDRRSLSDKRRKLLSMFCCGLSSGVLGEGGFGLIVLIFRRIFSLSRYMVAW